MDSRTLEHEIIWNKKPVLRLIYGDYYKRILKEINPGNILEIGGGSGNFKTYCDKLISIDILPAPWINIIADAHFLPFKNGFNNIVMVDVLHHLASPKKFFNEAITALKNDGKIIMIEPAITPVSWFFYNFFHAEDVILNAKPLDSEKIDTTKDPFDANQAIPTLIFKKYSVIFKELYPEINNIDIKYLSLFAYPLSGGFKSWSLIPAFFAKYLLKFEYCIEPILGKLFGFRLLIIINVSK